MTFKKLIFSLFLAVVFTTVKANDSGFVKCIERQLLLREQDSVLHLCRKLRKNQSLSSVEVDFYTAKGYFLLGKNGLVQYDSAEYYIEKVKRATKVESEEHFEALLFHAQIYLEKGSYKEALHLIQQQLLNTASDDVKKYRLNVLLFNVYNRIGDVDGAGKLYRVIREIPPALTASEKAKAYTSFGKYYLNAEKPEDAKRCFLKALKTFSKKEICYRVDVFHLLAEVEKMKGNTKAAMKIYKDLLQYEEKNEYRHGVIHTLLIAAETSLMSKGSSIEMSKYVDRVHQYALKLGNKLRLVQSYMNVGYYYFQMEDEEKSVMAFNQAMLISRVIKAYYWERSAARFLKDIYKQKGDYKNAFLYQQYFLEANEKYEQSNKVEKADMVRNIHLMYTYRTQMEKSAFELERKQTHLLIWISVSIGTLGISALLLVMYIRQKRNNKFLTEKALKESERKVYVFPSLPSYQLSSEPERVAEKPVIDASIYEDLQKRLQRFIEDKGFLDPDCSLSSMAKDFNTNTAYLSKYINEELKSSFNQLINEYRVHDFIERVKNDKEGRKTYTLDHLASLSGFSSKSTFIRAFKKQTGIAPSVFLKNIEEI